MMALSVPIMVMCTGILLCLHGVKRGFSRELKILLVLLACFGAYAFTNYGQLHTQVLLKDETYKAAHNGNPNKKVLFHLHDFFHYYMGAKYFDELGYYGLYYAVVLADKESPEPTIKLQHIRHPETLLYAMPMEEALEQARRDVRPKFSDARWEEFNNDLNYFKSRALPEWLDKIVFDAGVNSPPTWVAIASPIANLFPLTPDWLGFSPFFDPAEIPALFDIALLGIALFFVYRTFGLVGISIFFIALGTNQLVNYAWNIGSFFRYIWLSALIMGLCMLEKKHFLAAGIFFGIAAAERIFPVFFGIGAGLALYFAWMQNAKSRKDFFDFSIGAVASVAVLVLLSFAVVGFGAWKDFFENINEHGHIFFTNHIGFKRLAVFDDWVPVTVLILGATAFCAWKLRPAEAAMVIGSTCLFMLAMPANYYYIFLALLPMLWLRKPFDNYQLALLIIFVLAWAGFWIAPTLDKDDIIQNYYTNWVMLLMLIGFISVRGFQAFRNLK